MSEQLFNINDPVFDGIRSKFPTFSNYHDIQWAAACNENRNVFLTIREWNVTNADYQATFANTEANHAWTQQSFRAFINAQLRGSGDSFEEGLKALDQVHQYFVNKGATSFDCEISLSKNVVRVRISFIKESDWVSQTIYNVEFVWSLNKFTPWDAIHPDFKEIPFKLLETDVYGRMTRVSFLNPHTLEVYQTRAFNWKPDTNGTKFHAVSAPMADMDVVYTSQTTVGNDGVRCIYLGLYLTQPVEITEHIRGNSAASPNA